MKNFIIEIKWSLIIGILGLIWIFVEKHFGYHNDKVGYYQLFSILFFPIMALGYVLCLREKKQKYYNGNMSWTHGFISGIFLSAFLTILAPFGQFITHNFISPDMSANAIELATSKNTMTLEQATTYYNLNSFMMQSVFSTLSTGIVTGAVVAYFLRTKKIPNYEG